MQDITIRMIADYIKIYKEAYLSKESILYLVDPRMQKLKFAIRI